jgi:Transposase DDE domain
VNELDDWTVLLGVFPAEWRQLGRSSGAVRRLRGFSSLDALLRVLLLHVGCGWSLRETAVQAKLAGIADVSDVTLLNRLRDAEEWLRQLCQQLWKDNGVELQPSFKGRTVRLLDATVVREPGKTGSQWRIHYSLRLPTLECDAFDLTPTKGSNTAERFGRFQFHPGELVLADAGYCHPAGIAAVVQQQADVCVRLNPHALPLWKEHGGSFPLLESLAGLRKAGELAEWPVWIQPGQGRSSSGRPKIPGRVCAIRKSRDAIQQAERRLKDRQQKGKSVGPATRKYAEYVLVFTTLPATAASAEQVLEAYRLRWQVELTFKRLKSIAQLGHVPKHNDQSSRAWLYGKLFMALLSQKLARIGRTLSPWGYLLPEAENSERVA